MVTELTTPDSSFEIEMASAQLFRSQTREFTLSPELWNNLNLHCNLNWTPVKFEEPLTNQIPNNSMGIYAFVLEPGIANLRLAYLLYIGKTTRNFRVRFREYLRHKQETKPKRLYVKQMLTTWPDHLWFYYAPITDRDIVKYVEDNLIEAFKPPVCRDYPAKIRNPFKILDSS